MDDLGDQIAALFDYLAKEDADVLHGLLAVDYVQNLQSCSASGKREKAIPRSLNGVIIAGIQRETQVLSSQSLLHWLSNSCNGVQSPTSCWNCDEQGKSGEMQSRFCARDGRTSITFRNAPQFLVVEIRCMEAARSLLMFEEGEFAGELYRPMYVAQHDTARAHYYSYFVSQQDPRNWYIADNMALMGAAFPSDDAPELVHGVIVAYEKVACASTASN